MALNTLGWAFESAEKGKLDSLSPMARFVLYILAGYADHHRKAWPTQEQVADMAGTSVRSVARAVEELRGGGYVVVVKEKNPDDSVTNVYTLVLVPEEIAQKDTSRIHVALSRGNNVSVDPAHAEQPALLVDKGAEGRLSGLQIPKWLPKRELLSLPEWVPLETWIEFEQARKQLRRPVTTAGRKRLVASLENMVAEHDSNYAIMSIEQSLERGWLAFYPLTEEYLQKLKGQAKKGTQTYVKKHVNKAQRVFTLRCTLLPNGEEKILGEIEPMRPATPEEMAEAKRHGWTPGGSVTWRVE